MSRIYANLLLLLAALFWGAGNVAQKSALEDLGPLTIVGLRCLIGALVLVPFVRRERAARRTLARLSRPRIGIASALFAAAVLSQQIAFAGTTVTNASFLVTTTVIMTPIAAWWMYREQIQGVLWPAVCLTLLGVYLLGGASFDGVSWGDLLCLVSAAFYSAWIAYLGRLVAQLRCPGTLTLIQLALAGLCCFGAGLAFETFDPHSLMEAAPELVVLGVFATGLAFSFQARAQQHTGAGIAAVIMSTECVFGALGACLFMAEQPTFLTGAGAALILAAVLLVQLTPLVPATTGARLRDA